MRPDYEELDYRKTALGELILRRRRVAGLGDRDIYEVKLDDELLMSSLLHELESKLAELALPMVSGGPFEVLVGGLGLGHTTHAVLEDRNVLSVTVVELLPEVIEWHRNGLVPLGEELCGDPRCRFLQGDFFELVAGSGKSDLAVPDHGFGAILVDIDHAPDSWLSEDHRHFYGEAGLGRLPGLLTEGGVFGFWSSGRPRESFRAALDFAFARVETHEVEVYNPLVDEPQVDTIYLAMSREQG